MPRKSKRKRLASLVDWFLWFLFICQGGRLICKENFMFFLIVLFTGCNSQTQKENSNINKELVVTPTSIPVKKRPAKVNTQELKIPRTEKEYKEKFGTIDESGNFIPPKDSYVDKETGLIYNSDGVIIGSECTPHPAKPGSLG